MTPTAPPARWAWALVVGGWALIAVGPLLLARTAPLLLAVSVVGVLLVTVATVLLSGRIGLFALSFVLAAPLAAGLVQAREALVYQTSGRTVDCRVTAVTRHDRQVQVPDSHPTGAAATPGQHLETRVNYDHTMRCPNATYTLGRTRPSAVGTRYAVVYDPTGRVPPRFATGVPTLGPFLYALLTVPAVLLFLLPFLGWLAGRRYSGRGARPGPPTAPPGFGAPPVAPPGYRPWPGQGSGAGQPVPAPGPNPGRYGPGSSSEPHEQGPNPGRYPPGNGNGPGRQGPSSGPHDPGPYGR